MNRVMEPAIPRAEPEKEPMKVNAFDMGRRGNTQLLPIFPYVGPGSIVPCCAVLENDGTANQIGYFVHTNAADEVAVCIGGEGRGRTGDLFVGPNSHGVGGDGKDPFYAVMVITQRQFESGQQDEALTYQCEACNAELLHYPFGGPEYEAARPGILPSIIGGFEAASTYNSMDRRCPKCGHDNPTFPLHFWGWAQHVRASKIANRARAALQEVDQ